MVIRFVVFFLVALLALRGERLDLVEELSSYGKVETIEPMPDQGGSFINDVCLVTMASGERLVLKLENANWKSRKTMNEVSSLGCIGKYTEIPVPQVIAYKDQGDCEYILMNRMPGRALNLLIDEIYVDRPLYIQILHDLADVMSALQSHTFQQMGNFKQTEDAIQVISPIEFPLDVIQAPCEKFSEYAKAWLVYYTNEMKRLAKTDHPNQSHFAQLLPQMEALLAKNDFSILDDTNDLFVYCHQDFMMKNILIDQGRVSAILDWEWSGPALPEFELKTGFDFLRTQDDRRLFEEMMRQRGFLKFFQDPPKQRQLFYDLIGNMYALISCYEWTSGKLEHSAKFLAQKLEQRRVKSTKNFDMEAFALEKRIACNQLLDKFLGYKQPIALFGLSGSGKTTHAQGLCNQFPDQFSIIPITTSRAPRADDDLHYMEFLSKAEFIYAVAQGCFAMSWEQDGNCYGYRRQYFEDCQTHPILTCSLSAIQQVKQYGAVTVLIAGDGMEGLQARGSEEILQKRSVLNKINQEKYLNQAWFKENLDIEYDPVWGDVNASVQRLYNAISESRCAES